MSLVEPQGYTLGGLAREALARKEGSTTDATEYLVARLSKDAVLLRAVVRDAVRDAVSVHVEHSMRDSRRSILSQTTRGPDAVISLANGLSRALLDFQLANGVPLRKATREQVLDQADGYSKTAKDATHKARWLQAIGQSVPDGKTVGDVMNDERAAELYRETAT